MAVSTFLHGSETWIQNIKGANKIREAEMKLLIHVEELLICELPPLPSILKANVFTNLVLALRVAHYKESVWVGVITDFVWRMERHLFPISVSASVV